MSVHENNRDLAVLNDFGGKFVKVLNIGKIRFLTFSTVVCLLKEKIEIR